MEDEYTGGKRRDCTYRTYLYNKRQQWMLSDPGSSPKTHTAYWTTGDWQDSDYVAGSQRMQSWPGGLYHYTSYKTERCRASYAGTEAISGQGLYDDRIYDE